MLHEAIFLATYNSINVALQVARKNSRVIKAMLHEAIFLATCNSINVALQVARKNSRVIKAMLHEAIFLATCSATMTNRKPFKLQRGCHTFATSFATCNAYNNKQDGGNLLRAKDEL